MTGKLSGKKKEDFLKKVRRRLQESVEFDEENRREAILDLQFRNGDQWINGEKERRNKKGRPALTFNTLPRMIDQVVGELRQNRPRIKIRPVDSDGGPQLAQVYEGKVRNISYLSRSETIFDMAAESAVSCGYGGWRVITKYADDESFNQEIRLELVKNPFSIYLDPNAKDPTFIDGDYGFIIDKMSQEGFKRKYPNVDIPTSVGMSVGEGLKDSHWYEKDVITVAEYFEKEFDNHTLCQMSDGTFLKKDEANQAIKDNAAAMVEYQKHVEMFTANPTMGMISFSPQPVEELSIEREREVESFKIKHYVLTGADIIEGPNDWAGSFVPIIPVFGKELNIEGKRHVRGIVRFARDACRMNNYWQTTALERIALEPKAPFVGTAKQFDGHEDEWADANTENYAFLIYNSDPEAPGAPQRNYPGGVPAAIFAEIARAEQNIMSTTGMTEAALGMPSNERSGKAVTARRQGTDVGNFAYMDNLVRAIGHTGRILVDLIPKIYDTERDVRLRSIDDSEQFVPVNTTVGEAARKVSQNPERYKVSQEELQQHLMQYGPDMPYNHLDKGKFDVVVDTGPSYTTARVEAVDSIIKLMQTAPSTSQASMDVLTRNMDFPGAEELSERFRKMLPPGLATPREGDAPPPPPPPNPQQQQMQMQAQQAQMQMQVEMQKLAVEEKKMFVEMEKVRAELHRVQQETAKGMMSTDDHIRKVVMDVLTGGMTPRQ